MEAPRTPPDEQQSAGMSPDLAYALFYTAFFILLLIVAGFGLIAEF